MYIHTNYVVSTAVDIRGILMNKVSKVFVLMELSNLLEKANYM